MRVRCLCYAGFAVDPKYRVTWADVWLRFRARGKRYSFGPTLMSRYDLRGEILISRDCEKDNPGSFAQELVEQETLLSRLDRESVIIQNASEGCPDIYTSKDYIDREEAEAMLSTFMKHLGYSRFEFDWPEPSIVVHPAAFDVDKAEAAAAGD